MIICNKEVEDCMHILQMIDRSMLPDKRIEISDISNYVHYLKPALIVDIFEASREILEQKEEEEDIDLSTDQD